MCTIKAAKEFLLKYFRGISKADVKPYINIPPFHIPATCKELQYAAYLLVGDRCMSSPVQFPKPMLPGRNLYDWREGNYAFLFGSKLVFGFIPGNFRGLNPLSSFVGELPVIGYGKCITTPEQLIAHITKEENMKVELELAVVATPKMKPRTNDRLVFTYTNGATYTVRGLENARIHGMNILYVSKVKDAEDNVTVSEVRRRITNDFATVIIEKANGQQYMLLDLRSESTKKEAEKTTKPPRKRKSREEYEAEEAQREAEKAKLAKAEELLDAAAKLLN